MIKKVLIAGIMLVLMLGVAYAEDNITDTDDDATSDDSTIVPPQETQKESQITVKDITGKEKSEVKIRARITDDGGNPIKNVTLNFKINGKNFKSRSDEKGIASISYKLPKAKYVKTTTNQKKNIIYKTKNYETKLKLKVTFKANDNFTSSKAASKVISKKAVVVKKYRVDRIVRTEIVPCKKGDHTYKRGPVSIQVIKGKDFDMDEIWIAVEKKSGERLKISSKLHAKHNGKWKWDKEWKPMMSDHDTIILYYDKILNADLIKIRYELPKYTLLK